jgi:proline iminopeptidase
VLGEAGAPVLIAHHGAPGLGSRAEPRASFGRLADTFRVVVFDARGSGMSEGRLPFTHEQWAADVEGLRQWIGAERFVMAGGSYGGFIAMEYAIRHPERLSALVLRDTSPDHDNEEAAQRNAESSTRVWVDRDKLRRINEGRVRDNADLEDCWREILPLYDYDYDPAAVEVKAKATPYRFETHNFAFSVNVPRYETDLLLHTYKVSHDWSRQLLTGEAYVPGSSEPHQCDPSHFSEMDRAILARLRGDGRAGFRTVARDLKMNERTVRRRFEALRERGCAMVFTLVPAVSLGFESEIVLQITVAPSRLDALARELATYRGVRYVGSTLGASSLMCEVILPTTRDVYEFVTQTLGDLDGVQGWTASMELVTFKRGFVETPWWRRALVDGRSAWLHPRKPA